MVVLRVQVVEEVAGSRGLRGLYVRASQDVDVRPTARHNEAGHPLFDGAFQGQPGTDESNATTAFELIAVAFLQAKVEHAGHPSTKPRGHAAFVNFHRRDGVGVEDAEKPKQMARVVNGGVVKEQQVLVGSSATNVKAAVPLTGALDAGQHLDGFQDVHFAHQGRQTLNGRHGHFGLAEGSALRVLSGGAHHFCSIHLDRLGRQGHVPFHVFESVHFSRDRGIANERALQLCGTTRQG